MPGENTGSTIIDLVFQSVKGSGEEDGMLEDFEIISQVRLVENLLARLALLTFNQNDHVGRSRDDFQEREKLYYPIHSFQFSDELSDGVHPVGARQKSGESDQAPRGTRCQCFGEG